MHYLSETTCRQRTVNDSRPLLLREPMRNLLTSPFTTSRILLQSKDNASKRHSSQKRAENLPTMHFSTARTSRLKREKRFTLLLNSRIKQSHQRHHIAAVRCDATAPVDKRDEKLLTNVSLLLWYCALFDNYTAYEQLRYTSRFIAY